MTYNTALAIKGIRLVSSTLSKHEIKAFLESAPLYTTKTFQKPTQVFTSLRIKQVDAFCDTCKQHRPFQDLRPRGAGSGRTISALSTGETFLLFTCVSCRKESLLYCIHQDVTEDEIKLMKFGELPRRPLPRDKALQSFLSEDAELYEKAVVSLANGYGIGAFAYFRRILESHIFKLLDLLLEDAKEAEVGDTVTEALAELKKESPMSERIQLANNALPGYLKPAGTNPLGRLYQVLSEGVHSLSDSECLEKATAIKDCLSFLVSELSSRKRHREAFGTAISRL